MRRNPELAHLVSELPEVRDARHFAIDKLTACHLVVDLLSRATNREISALEEIELEERVEELSQDATYHWIRYMRMKRRKYEELLHQESADKSDTIIERDKTILHRDTTITKQDALLSHGNTMINQHSKDLNVLKKERGLS